MQDSVSSVNKVDDDIEFRAKGLFRALAREFSNDARCDVSLSRLRCSYPGPKHESLLAGYKVLLYHDPLTSLL